MRKSFDSYFLAVIILVVTGCGTQPQNRLETIENFSKASEQAAIATMDAIQAVNQANNEAFTAQFVRDFGKARELPTFEPYISQASIDSRRAVLNQIRAYSTLLLDVASKRPMQDLSGASDALGKQLQDFRIPGHAALATPEITSGITKAINSIGEVLIEKRQSEGIATAAKRADPHIQQICKWLIDDARHLRDQLKAASHERQQDYFRYLREAVAPSDPTRAGGALTPLTAAQKREEIERVARLIIEGVRVQERFSGLDETIEQLARAHSAVVAVSTEL